MECDWLLGTVNQVIPEGVRALHETVVERFSGKQEMSVIPTLNEQHC